MKAKYRFVGKYLKNNAFLNDTKCTLAQVQPYNATFTVTLLSWPNNYSEYFFLSHLICSGDLFAIDLHSSSQGVCLAFELLLENYRPFFSKLFFYTTTFEKKSKGIVIITIKKTIFQNFEIHGSYNMAWLMAIIVVWWKRM